MIPERDHLFNEAWGTQRSCWAKLVLLMQGLPTAWTTTLRTWSSLVKYMSCKGVVVRESSVEQLARAGGLSVQCTPPLARPAIPPKRTHKTSKTYLDCLLVLREALQTLSSHAAHGHCLPAVAGGERQLASCSACERHDCETRLLGCLGLGLTRRTG